MSEMNIEQIVKVVSPLNVKVEIANKSHLALFENDLNENDRYDLGRTWRNDWRGELYATLENSSPIFIFSSDLHRGVAMFGLNVVMPGCAQIWLHQSRSFVDGALQHGGDLWAHQFVAMNREIVDLCCRRNLLLFNFISAGQSDNIRWLKKCGFEFVCRQDGSSDLLLIGRGEGFHQFSEDIKLWRAFLGGPFCAGSADRTVLAGKIATGGQWSGKGNWVPCSAG